MTMATTIAKDEVGRLDDDTLLAQLRALVRRSNELEADLLEHLAEVDERRLYLPDHTSMFAFCMAELGFGEAAAENRIAVARASRRFPRALAMLRTGAIHLSGLRVLVPHLNDESADALFDQARGKSKREIEQIVACHAPKPAVADSIRKVPERHVAEPETEQPGTLFCTTTPSASTPPAPRPAIVAPLAPDRYHVQLTANRELRDKIEVATALLRHQVPNGDLATILDRALTVLIDKVKKDRFGVGRKPRSKKFPEGPAKGRDIPDAIKRAVYERDGGQCTFVGPNGTRCQERGFLELDHLDGFARRKEHVASRITLRCSAHNQYAAIVMYGPELMARKRKERQASKRPAGASAEGRESGTPKSRPSRSPCSGTGTSSPAGERPDGRAGGEGSVMRDLFEPRVTDRGHRPKVERKIAHLTRRRHGGRRARMRGSTRNAHDLALLAAAVNLRRLAVLGLRFTDTVWSA